MNVVLYLAAVVIAVGVVVWFEWVLSEHDRKLRREREQRIAFVNNGGRDAAPRDVVTEGPVLPTPLRLAEDGPRDTRRDVQRVPALLRFGSPNPVGRAEVAPRRIRPAESVEDQTAPVAAFQKARVTFPNVRPTPWMLDGER